MTQEQHLTNTITRCQKSRRSEIHPARSRHDQSQSSPTPITDQTKFKTRIQYWNQYWRKSGWHAQNICPHWELLNSILRFICLFVGCWPTTTIKGGGQSETQKTSAFIVRWGKSKEDWGTLSYCRRGGLPSVSPLPPTPCPIWTVCFPSSSLSSPTSLSAHPLMISRQGRGRCWQRIIDILLFWLKPIPSPGPRSWLAS
jgi:hypothetical protein